MIFMQNIKRLLLIVISCMLLFSCKKEQRIEAPPLYGQKPEHVPLGFELDEPDVILKDFATGQLNADIESVVKSWQINSIRPSRHQWLFQHVQDSKKISHMSYFQPHYVHCEIENFTFIYNAKGDLDSIIKIYDDYCIPFSIKYVYTYNYNEKGLLKSIFMDCESYVEENYIGYYPNGKVKEIYHDFRGSGVDADFNVQKFYYDPTFSNVVRVERRDSHGSETTLYTYDTSKNPFKGFFISVSTPLPNIGPAYLSENNIKSKYYVNNNNTNGVSYMTNYIYNYVDGKLKSFSEADTADVNCKHFYIN